MSAIMWHHLGISDDLDGGMVGLFGKWRQVNTANTKTGSACAHISHLISPRIFVMGRSLKSESYDDVLVV